MKLIIFFIFFVKLNVGNGVKFVSLEDSSEKFAVDIFKNLILNKDENQLISPISIQSILGLLQTGVTGKSLNELSKVLYLPKRADRLIELFENYQQLINNSKIDLTTVNNIFVADKFKLPRQIITAAKVFNAHVEKIDPLVKSRESVERINRWVKNQTNNKIENIVNDDIINPYTVMVLVNALYFNAQWKFPFDVELTRKRNFHLSDNRQMKTDLMMQTGKFNYTNSEILNAKILELPYENENYVMNIILPNDKNGLNALINKMHLVFGVFDRQTDEEEINIMMPKFKFQYETQLNDVLKKLGLNSIFSQIKLKGDHKEQIKGQTRPNLQVSRIMHKTYIDVNEKGSEAAAATAVGIEDRMGNFDKIFFTADHPFMFVIRHKKPGVILFMGTYKTPEI